MEIKFKLSLSFNIYLQRKTKNRRSNFYTLHKILRSPSRTWAFLIRQFDALGTEGVSCDLRYGVQEKLKKKFSRWESDFRQTIAGWKHKAWRKSVPRWFARANFVEIRVSFYYIFVLGLKNYSLLTFVIHQHKLNAPFREEKENKSVKTQEKPSWEHHDLLRFL